MQLQKTSIIATIILLSFGCEKDVVIFRSEGHYDYEHPDEWANQGYAECAGKVGTPIDIDPANTYKVTLAPLNFQYQNFSMKIVDNGHTIQVNSNGESSIVYEGVTYSFKQFHYHHKSEHTFEGNFRDLEIHLVHRDDLTGNLLVLGIWVTPGAANNLMEAVKLNIPVEKFSEQSTSISINATDLLPSDAQTLNPKYYRYTGSLTTPPCTQGVTWVMFHNPITMSQTQIDAFAQMYEVNNRPVQPLNNRIVFEQQ